MLLSPALAKAINTQIGNELAASLQYCAIEWFVDVQLEEVTKMQRLLGVVRMAGEKNRLSVEAYLMHGGA